MDPTALKSFTPVGFRTTRRGASSVVPGELGLEFSTTTGAAGAGLESDDILNTSWNRSHDNLPAARTANAENWPSSIPP
jgi:hypothetical protein